MQAVRSPSELPEFRAAVADEWLQRTLSFHSLIETVEGFQLLPMTLRHYSALRLAGSPFLPPFATPGPEAIAQFLWALSPSRRLRWLFLRRCRKFARESPRSILLRIRLVKKLRDFVEVTMADRPPRTVSDGIPEPEYYCDECSIVSAIARDRGWSELEIMEMPLRRIFQYLKEIREHNALRAGVPPMLCNRSEEVADKYLGEINRRN